VIVVLVDSLDQNDNLDLDHEGLDQEITQPIKFLQNAQNIQTTIYGQHYCNKKGYLE
jgi:hypothetical protein